MNKEMIKYRACVIGKDGHKYNIIFVEAHNKNDANIKITRDLIRQGRLTILAKWIEQGSIVEISEEI